jgi:hypothetical protein
VPGNSRDDSRGGIHDGDGDLRQEPPRRGARSVSAILPNGRVVWLRVAPDLASAASLRQAADTAEHAQRWRHAEAAANTRGMIRLARTIAGDVETVGDARVERLERLRRHMVAGDDRVARRLAKAREKFRSRLARQMEVERAAVDRLVRRDLWDKIVILTSLPLFAAYGQSGNPFGPNNLALVVSLAVWLVGDEIRDALFGSEKRSPYPVPDMDAWAYLAPLCNLLAGWWLMSEYQHERFITGATKTFAPREPEIDGLKVHHEYVSVVNLAPFMPLSYFAEFAAFDRVAAVATPRTVTLSAAGLVANATVESVRAEVRDGALEIRLRAIGDKPVGPPPWVIDVLEIAWMVDTQKPEPALP